MRKQKYILVLNSGSTSLKFKIFNYYSLKEIHCGAIEKIGLKKSIIQFDNSNIKNRKTIINHSQALKIINDFIKNETNIKISLILHRIVHGGVEFNQATKLDQKTINKISKYNNLAPLHNPVNLKVAQEALKIWPRIKQIGMFDTMFFKNIPLPAYLYPLPLKYFQKYNIRKFGFHGFSHQNMLKWSAKNLKKRINQCNLITCHLGGGSSIAVIKNGEPIEISMGFSPSSGLMMMNRAGDLDPAIIFHLLKNAKMSLNQIYQLLNFESGLRGMTKIGDLRDIMILAGYKIKNYSSPRLEKGLGGKSNTKATKENKQLAKLALDLFIYKIQRYLSSYITLLPKIDAIVFSGAIGERNADIRNLIFKNIYFPKKYKKIIVKCNEEKIMAEIIKKINL